MKLLKFAGLVLFCGLVGTAFGADITVYYSPTCPHCHHARDFIKSELIYVYNDLKVEEVNVMENRQDFFNVIKQCEYTSGGVPVLVVGDKCFQGYSDSMQNDIRKAIEEDLTDEQKQAAASNKSEFDKDKKAFIESHKERINAVFDKDAKKKLSESSSFDATNAFLISIMVLLLIGLGIVMFKKQK